MKQAMPKADRERLVSRVIDDLNAMPTAIAAVHASDLYGREGLSKVEDTLLRYELCRALVRKFNSSSAPALGFWKSLI